MYNKRKSPEPMTDINETENISEIENIINNNGNSYLIKWVGSKKLSFIDEKDFIQTEFLNEYKQYKIVRDNKDIKRKAYIYCRTSKRNNLNEVSLENQESLCKEFAIKNNINIAGIFRDNGVSAREFSNQYSLNHIIDNLLEEGQMIICYDISRFSRNMNNAIEKLEYIRLNKKSLVHSVYDNLTWNNIATNRHNFRQILSTTQLLSDTVSDKVKASIKFKKDRGDHIGYIPYGYRRITTNEGVKKLCKDDDEQKVINKIYDLTIDVISDNLEKYVGFDFYYKKLKKDNLTHQQYIFITDSINKLYKNRNGKLFSVYYIKNIINKLNLF